MPREPDKKPDAAPLLLMPFLRSDSDDGPIHEGDWWLELINSIPAIVWVASAKTSEFKFVSGYAETLLGYPARLWVEKPSFWKERIYPEDQERTIARRAHGIQEGHYDIEYRLVARDGRIVWVRELGHVPAGEGAELTGVIVDLSQKRSPLNVLGDGKIWLRQIIDSIPVQIWSGTADGTIDFCNARWRDDLGLTLESAQGNGWQQVLHPEERERVVEAWRYAVAKGTPFEQHERLRMANNGYRYFLSRAIPMHDERGELVRWFGSNTDIDDQTRAEDALRQSEGQLRNIVNTIPAQIWSASPEGAIDYCNDRCSSDKGMTLEELQGEGWLHTIRPDDRSRVMEAWRVSLRDGTPYEMQQRYQMANGEYRWFLCRSLPLRDSEGRIVEWYGTNADIDDQKQAEEALRKSEQQWHGVFDNSRIGIAVQDASLRYIDANAAFTQLVGYSREELQTMTCLDITYYEDRTRLKTLVDELLSGKRRHFEMEKRYRRRDGELVWARLNGSVVDGADSSLLWVVMAEDISERKSLGDELQQERDRLRLLLDLNRHFVSKLDVRELFQALLEGVRRLGWHWASVLLPENGSGLTVYLSPDNAYLREGQSLPIDDSIQGEVFRSGKAVAFRIDDLPALCGVFRKNQRMQEVVRSEGIQAGCALPLIHEGTVIGVLFLMTRAAQDLPESEMNFLQELASLVAASLHNSLRFQIVNEQQERLLSERKYIEAESLQERGISEIIGDSPAILEVLKQVSVVAPTESAVLINGETGTGKELIARAIHNRSARRNHSFIKVDSAAIPSALMESELFGYERGAFTGASGQKLGRIELADHGTLFLDEIGDVPLELQSKLLRILQDHAFERLGGTRTRKIDVRVVAATHRNLELMVEGGSFREDLYYRLKVFPIVIPPLRDRPADIPLLIRYYVEKYARRMRKPVPTVPQPAMDVFLRYPWPGNVRELQHFIERSVILTSGRELQAPLSELQQVIQRKSDRRPTGIRTLEDVERESILKALKESNWVVGGRHGAAVKLGLKRTTLASRMEKLGIYRP